MAVRDDRLAVQISEMSNRELVEKVRGHIRALAAPGSQVKYHEEQGLACCDELEANAEGAWDHRYD